MLTFRSVDALLRLLGDVAARARHGSAVPVVYFTGTRNVGDLLNEYLIPRLSGKNIVKVRSAALPHLRAAGSVIGSSSKASFIWGSGSIDGKMPNRSLRSDRVFALRGKKTHELVRRITGDNFQDLPLGDPAVLMPSFYQPKANKDVEVGIVPHFSDEAKLREMLCDLDSRTAKIISFRQSPTDFIDQMCKCKCIFSTSLHGLVLADSYEIPNKWLSVSSRLIGGTFKFEDYYSTTNAPKEGALEVKSGTEMTHLIRNARTFCNIKEFSECRHALKQSFPL